MAKPSYASRVIADGAVAYWPLDEASGSAIDRIGGLVAAVTGGVVRGVPGPLPGSRAMRFDGATGQAKVPPGSYPALAFGTGPLSLECWVRATGVWDGGGDWIIDTKYNGSGEQGVALHFSDTVTLVAGVRLGGGAQTFSQTAFPAFPSSDWHHVVVTLTRGAPDGLSVYLDAATSGPNAPATAGLDYTSTSGLAIAATTTPLTNCACEVAHVALYRTALTPAQILAHYQLGVGTFEKPKRHKSSAAPSVDRRLLDGAVAAGTISPAVDVAGAATVSVSVIGNGAVSAGLVTIEEAHDVNYAGTWAARAGYPVQPGTVTTLQATETFKAIRARVSTAIVGGSVSVHVVAAGD